MNDMVAELEQWGKAALFPDQALILRRARDEIVALRALVGKLGDDRTLATKLIRAEALEEAALLFETFGRQDPTPGRPDYDACAAAIRALKGKP